MGKRKLSGDYGDDNGLRRLKNDYSPCTFLLSRVQTCYESNDARHFGGVDNKETSFDYKPSAGVIPSTLLSNSWKDE